ncbi:MAG: bifunctional diaminohydroxyphosphoribosylaminopyrimidine deaminase/5-amino-6-(5-phosphoribosylamino)uracil reductase RibD [Bacteroidales bacterium]|nr:bifunctional diaminohydroxyphosphoribosylaminopyrimidine deaminase/5-amino-6-(5-phosphoribosylamino)uracil reductase RibD [Bacteroidales bacterium]
MDELDIVYMRRCLQLAANGLGRVRPNPLVGSVVVENGRIISEGFHQEYGHNHAERNALLRSEVGSRKSEQSPLSSDLRPPTSDLTLYVNLEPCSHHGKTPPCADLIVEKGIKRVVCCNDDPNPLVAGNGFRKLEEAGIEVTRHVLEEEGRELNRRFFTFMEQRRPYVILKWAESADGYMAPATPGSYWLSTQRQNRLNHRWRTEEAAILVGSGTYLADNPSLTPRHYLGPAPRPVVLDRRNRLANVPSHWLHLHTPTIEETLQALYEAKLQSVIVEGGRQILDAFIKSGLYDEVRILRSPLRLGDGLKAPEVPPVAPERLTIID